MALWLALLLAQASGYRGFRAQSLELLRQDTLVVLHLVGSVEVTLEQGIMARAAEAYYTEKTGFARLLGGVEVQFPWGRVTSEHLEYQRFQNFALFRDSVTVQDTGGRVLRAHQMAYRPDTAWFQWPRLQDPRRNLRLQADTGRAVGRHGCFWGHAVLWWQDSSVVRADTLWLLQDTVVAVGQARVQSGRFQGTAWRVKITESRLQMSDPATVTWNQGRLEAGEIQIWQEDSSRYRILGTGNAFLESPGEQGTLSLRADTLKILVVRDTLRQLWAWPVKAGEYRENPKDASHGENPENP